MEFFGPPDQPEPYIDRSALDVPSRPAGMEILARTQVLRMQVTGTKRIAFED